MKLLIAASLFASLYKVAVADVTSLSSADFGTETAGKVVFIKFFAPWCGHCKAMAEDYEKLAAEYKDNKQVLIAEVDCTVDANEELCGENGVEGFPTLKYGEPSSLETYEGARSYDALSSFCKENLKPSCSPNNLSLCDDVKKAKIEEMMAMSEDDLYEEISKVDDAIAEADSYLQSEIEKLQATYQELMAKVTEMKKSSKIESNYSMMKAVMAMKKQSSNDNDEL